MKLKASLEAFSRYFPDVQIRQIEVPAPVSAQPLSFGEIVRGARARARSAYGEGEFSVGIEAGLFRVASVAPTSFQITMACVFDGTREGLGAGPFYQVPQAMVHGVVQSDTGSVYVVTRGKVTREEVTRDAVLMALAPFVSPELYGP
jgi:inosine/xanthosine triphosphatase